MKTVKVKVYTYDELNEDAKQKACEWYGEGNFDWPWEWECLQGEALEMYVELEGTHRNTMEGSFTQYPSAVAQKIVGFYGESSEIYKTAKAFLEWQQQNDHESDHDDDETSKWFDERDEAEKEFERAILEDYRIISEHQQEWVQSREYIEDQIRANEYTFTKDGKRFG